MALNALSEFYRLVYSDNFNIHLQVDSNNSSSIGSKASGSNTGTGDVGALQWTFDVDRSNSLVLQTKEVSLVVD